MTIVISEDTSRKNMAGRISEHKNTGLPQESTDKYNEIAEASSCSLSMGLIFVPVH